MVAMPPLAAPRFDFDRWFDDNGVRMIAILVTAVVVTIVTRFLVRRVRRKLRGEPSLTQELNLQRVTTLRAFDGTLHVVPNGNIQVVSNKSRGWARAIVDVRVAYGEDVGRVREVLEELFDEIRKDPVLKDWIMEGPSILGVESLADYA